MPSWFHCVLALSPRGSRLLTHSRSRINLISLALGSRTFLFRCNSPLRFNSCFPPGACLVPSRLGLTAVHQSREIMLPWRQACFFPRCLAYCYILGPTSQLQPYLFLCLKSPSLFLLLILRRATVDDLFFLRSPFCRRVLPSSPPFVECRLFSFLSGSPRPKRWSLSNPGSYCQGRDSSCQVLFSVGLGTATHGSR